MHLSSTCCDSSWKELQLPPQWTPEEVQEVYLGPWQRVKRKCRSGTQNDFAQLLGFNCGVREIKCLLCLLKYLKNIYENVFKRDQSEEECQDKV